MDINNKIEKLVYKQRFLQELLPKYYDSLFPYNLFYRWLSYGDSSYFLQRELSFTLPRHVFIRYKSFESEKEFVRYLTKKCPVKVDIGAVFDVPPRDRCLTKVIKAREKELVFDIDMNDYDEVRTCCKEANVCNKCWKFLVIACKILDAILREDFGFQHILWVFSGRRGIHCWVCDKEARTLSDEERNDILGYMTLIQGGKCVSRRVKLPTRPIHSSIQRALAIINENFIDFIIKEQNILGTGDGLKKFLDMLWDGPRSDFEEIMSKYETSEERWNAFVVHFNDLLRKNVLPNKLKYLKEEIILHYTYPRIDAMVTRRRDHLLKSPFCVHPETGNVSVPIRLEELEQFDLNEVPKINLILDELEHRGDIKRGENYRCGGDNSSVIKNLKNTSLLKYFYVFEGFVLNLETSIKNANKKIDLDF